MGIHNEATLARYPPLEAEIRRRLWWSLINFDSRIGEMSDSKCTSLTPTWDCKIPLNVNDSDFGAEAKEPPQAHGNCSDALFCVVRGELSDYIRNTTFHLEFNNPALKAIAKELPHGNTSGESELDALERIIEDKYFKYCDLENPIHFVTIWTSRSYLAKCRLMEHLCRNYKESSVPLTNPQRDAAILYSIEALEHDTTFVVSPLSKRYMWLFEIYFPLPPYIHLVSSLKRRPLLDHAARAWEAMSENYEARFGRLRGNEGPFLKVFTKLVLEAWAVREAALRSIGQEIVPPKILPIVRYQRAMLESGDTQSPETLPSQSDMGADDFSVAMGYDENSAFPFYGIGGQNDFRMTVGGGGFSNMSGNGPLEAEINQLDWSAMDWDMVNPPGKGW